MKEYFKTLYLIIATFFMALDVFMVMTWELIKVAVMSVCMLLLCLFNQEKNTKTTVYEAYEEIEKLHDQYFK